MDFWAGYISGAVGICIGNPLDIVKVRLQAGRYASLFPVDPSKRRNQVAFLKGKALFMLFLIPLIFSYVALSRSGSACTGIWCSQFSSLHDLQPLLERT